MSKLSPQERSSLIKLASELPPGDETRRAVLSGLSKVGMTEDKKKQLSERDDKWQETETARKKGVAKKVIQDLDLKSLPEGAKNMGWIEGGYKNDKGYVFI